MSAWKVVFASMAFLVSSLALGAPDALAQQGDRCSELQTVLEESSVPAADSTQQAAQTTTHNAVQAGYDALQCGGPTPIAGPIELNRQFMSPGYQTNCPAVAQAPMPPSGRLTTPQFNEVVPAYNNWATVSGAALSCRAAEVRELQRQRAIATAIVAAWNWRTQRQVADASTAFSQAQPRESRR